LIIGRTDENDIIVNHRRSAATTPSWFASRHRPLTISDLQSPNGVRVNGQTRQGRAAAQDLIDSATSSSASSARGDFVFARDAVITDVPRPAASAHVVAILAAALVLVVGIVIYATHGNGDNKPVTRTTLSGPTTPAVLRRSTPLTTRSPPPRRSTRTHQYKPGSSHRCARVPQP
jgi:hypothetical protein